MFRKFFNKIQLLVGGALMSVGFAAPALAEEPSAGVDYSALVNAADFSGLGTAASGVIVALIGVSLLVSGGMVIWRLTRQGRSA